MGIAEGGGTLRMALTALSILLLDKKREGIRFALSLTAVVFTRVTERSATVTA
ncbi:MAG: hypothetical protein ACLTEX_01420 [Eggerthella lenta]